MPDKRSAWCLADELTGLAAGGGHWNHSFFWKVLGKPADNNGPSDALKSAIGESHDGSEATS